MERDGKYTKQWKIIHIKWWVNDSQWHLLFVCNLDLSIRNKDSKIICFSNLNSNMSWYLWKRWDYLVYNNKVEKLRIKNMKNRERKSMIHPWMLKYGLYRDSSKWIRIEKLIEEVNKFCGMWIFLSFKLGENRLELRPELSVVLSEEVFVSLVGL